MVSWWFTTFMAPAIKEKVHNLDGVEYLYDVIAPSQLEIPAYITEYDMTVSAFINKKLGFYFYFVDQRPAVLPAGGAHIERHDRLLDTSRRHLRAAGAPSDFLQYYPTGLLCFGENLFIKEIVDLLPALCKLS